MKKLPEQFVEPLVNPHITEINKLIKEKALEGYTVKSIAVKETGSVTVFYILFEEY
jgi:hypothetical protein